MQIFLIITAVIFAAACGILSFLALSLRRREQALSQRIGEAESRTAAETARCTELADRLRERDLALLAARKDIEALTARLEEEDAKLKEKNEMLMLRFEKTANEIFERKTHQFRDANKESLDLILKPLKDNISDFKQRVEEIYSKENENRGALKAELNNLMELNRRITEETNNLTSALRGNSKVQGDWGEMILDTILESSNLQKGIHYTTQTNVKDAEGNNLRPDVILNLPDGKRVVIDSKVSLTAYVNYCACEDEESRRRTMADHLRSVRSHVNELGRKSYQESVLGSPDFVIMFIPTEPAFLAAVQHEDGLWDEAYRKKVIISSPTNLFGMLKIVDDLWKRDDLGRNANRIAREGAMMYDKFVGFVNTLESIGKNIDTMQGNYDKAMKQLRTGTGNLVSRAQRLSALNIKISKSLPQSMLEESDDLPAEE
jgi:DNA recombination protein RmuC